MDNINDDMIVAMWNNGEFIKDIIKIVPLPEKKAYNYIKALQKEGVLRKENRQNRIVSAYYNISQSPQEIASYLNIKVKRVYNVLKQHGLKPNYKHIKIRKDNKTQLVLDGLKKGKTQSQIARELGISRQRVSIIRKNNENKANDSFDWLDIFY